jgi:hypothetical protein|tara:strand:- start:317 stop:484 length:168 start_codon:yes stop_codon:yes gene_type:complete
MTLPPPKSLILKGGSRVTWVTSKEGERYMKYLPFGITRSPLFEEGGRKEKKFFVG